MDERAFIAQDRIMSPRKAQPQYVTLPGRHFVYRASLLLMVAASSTLFVMNKTGNPAAERVKTHIMDVVTPVLAFAASPFDAVHNAAEWVKDMVALRDENIALKNDNVQLLKWQSAAKEMQEENASLREMLNVVPDEGHTFVTAKIVSDVSGPYMYSALISGGNENGIKKDQAIVNDRGLVGRTIDVGDSSARVLLLSDINSRVPVMAETTHEKSILSGNNSALPTLSYLPANFKLKAGERIVTSGDGGVFPPGIAVGVVQSTEKGEVSVQLFADPATLNYVSAIDYSL